MVEQWPVNDFGEEYDPVVDEEMYGDHYIAIYENEGIQALIDELHANPPMGPEIDELIAQAEASGYEEVLFTLEDMGMM